MGIKVYVSKVSGNMEIKRMQDHIIRILQSKHIEFEEVDVSDPLLEKERDFMREHSKSKNGQKPMPPQVFFDDKYCGDFDAFSEAVEDDRLQQFLSGNQQQQDDHDYEHLDMRTVSKGTALTRDINSNLLPTSDDV